MASYYFYMCWDMKYIVLIIFVTVVSFVVALLIEKVNPFHGKIIQLCGIVSCLSVLFYFKYFNFIIETVVSCLNHMAIPANFSALQIILPAGISFYTFQAMSYIVDVYQGKIKAERHLGIYAAYISFFPQLVAGPIERTDHLLPQIKREQSFSYEKAVDGLKIMLWGFYKKVVVADTLAIYVDKVYNNLSDYKGFDLALAVLFFTLQIYCDFSGYSDIAVGTAKLMGIELITNFNAPYFSLSVKEFWSRWHISLSSWFRDYIYIPLGGNRCVKWRHYLNILITFLLSGLWHGANWTFIFWGGVMESHKF